ncbi:hypothetical protein ABZ408_38980 [Streptomyces tibetensis]
MTIHSTRSVRMPAAFAASTLPPMLEGSPGDLHELPLLHVEVAGRDCGSTSTDQVDSTSWARRRTPVQLINLLGREVV